MVVAIIVAMNLVLHIIFISAAESAKHGYETATQQEEGSYCVILSPKKIDPISNRRSSTKTVSVKLATGCGVVDDQTLHRKYATGKLQKTKQTMHKICTWNVQGLNRVGKFAVVERVVEGISVTGLSETHWKYGGHFTSQNGNLILCSGNEINSANGVSFIIDKTIKGAVLGYETVNDRIITIKLQAQPVNLNIIQVYAPTSVSFQDEIESFYGTLSDTISRTPNRELLIVTGDFNAKIGSTKFDAHLRSVVGNYGIGRRNEHGEMLIDFCAENGLYISNSHFQHHSRRMYTWKSPDGHTRNQINYLLIRKRWKTSIRDIKTYPGLDCGSDHALVAELCLKLCKPIRMPRQMNRWHLGCDSDFKKMSDTLDKITQEEMDRMNANELWMEMKNVMDAAASSVSSRKNDQPRKSWISQQTWNLIKERREVKAKGTNDNQNTLKYHNLTRKINKAMRMDKDAYVGSICQEIEKHSNSNQPGDLFRKVRTLSKDFRPCYLLIKDDN